MGKQVAQGTAHETDLKRKAESRGRVARRIVKTATAHEADLEIEGNDLMIPVVAWKNLVKTEGKSRRRSSRMVIMSEKDWLHIVDRCPDIGYYVQAKATQTLRVRHTLEGLIGWMREQGE